MALCCPSTALWIVFTQMPSIARERNSALAVAAGLKTYFTGVHFPRKIPRLSLSPLLKKEPLVGLLFTAACALPALTRATASTRPARRCCSLLRTARLAQLLRHRPLGSVSSPELCTDHHPGLLSCRCSSHPRRASGLNPATFRGAPACRSHRRPASRLA